MINRGNRLDPCIFLSDEEDAPGGKQVAVLGIGVVERNAAIGDRQFAQQQRRDGGRLSESLFLFEPAIVAFAGSRIRDIGQLHLQFIHDPLVTGLADLTTTDKERVSDDGLSDELARRLVEEEEGG